MAPTGPVAFEILDLEGAVLRRIETQGRVGMNRATWDLRFEGPAQVELRTKAPDNPFIFEEARFQGRETRPIIHWGIGGPQRAGPIAAPGKFTVRMTANGKSYTQPFEIAKDPAIPSSDADLVESTNVQRRIVADMNESVDMINRLELMRKQIEDQLEAQKGKADRVRALQGLDKKMMDVELQLLSRTDMHSDDKWYVESYKVYMQLIWLYAEVGNGAGDVQGGAEYRPTAAAMEWLATVEKELSAARAAFRGIVEREVPAFNQGMGGRVPAITDRT
jgi:hypothetical protein